MTTRILVTGAGGASAVSFMRAVTSPEIELFAGDIDAYAAGLYIVPAAHRLILRRGDDPQFVDDLLERCIAEHVDVLVPTVDTELLPIAKRRDDFDRHDIKLLLGEASTFEICLDKWKLVSACAEVCPVPRSEIIDAAFSLDAWPMPFLIKPRRGAGGRGVRRIDYVEEFASCPRDGSVIAQEYLGGPEYSVDVLCAPDKTVLSVVPRARLKIDSGIAVAGRTVHDPRLEALGAAVARRLGIIFVANVQFREDASGTPKLIDVNARFPGTMPLTVGSGVDMPRLALDLVLGKPVDPKALHFREIAVVRTWQEHFIDSSEVTHLENAMRTRDAR